MEGYLFSLHSLREEIAHAPSTRGEDVVLATTICLCLFESFRSDGQPNFYAHATAAGALLTRRERAQTQTKPQSAAIFERICAESFLYHSSLMMLLDPSLDTLTGVEYTSNWARYFPDPQAEADTSPDADSQPVLDAPYESFLLIADVARLARISRPLDEGEVQRWEHLQSELLRYEQVANHNTCKTLRLLAMHILLLKVHPTLPVSEVMDQISGFLQRGLTILDPLDMQNHFLGYLLWPLAVLGSIAVDSHARHIVWKKIVGLADTQHGHAICIWNWIEYIWDFPQGDRATMTMRGLWILMEGPEGKKYAQ